MPVLLQNIFIGHVMLGLIGVAFLVVVLVGLLRKNINIKLLKISSLLSLLSFLGSWFLGGYYYVTYYGKAVKPTIKAGDYRWAHSVIMETKEHVFLFIPFLVAISFLVILLEGDRLNIDSKLKKALILVVASAVVLGVLIMLAGVVISGAYNPI